MQYDGRVQFGSKDIEQASSAKGAATFVSKCERGERRNDAVELVEYAEARSVSPQGLLAEYLEQRGSLKSPQDTKGIDTMEVTFRSVLISPVPAVHVRSDQKRASTCGR